MVDVYHVLVVDDDFQDAELLSQYLKISGQFEVEYVNCIAELWTRLATGKYDLILLDYRLPDGTGLDVLRQMPAALRETPVVLVTGQSDERLVVEAMQLGASDYLVKGTDFIRNLSAILLKVIHTHQLKLSMQRSQEQNRFQALLLNNVRDAIVAWDTSGRISHWNPAAEGLYGTRMKDALGQQVEDLYFPSFIPPVRPPRSEDTLGHEITREFAGREGRKIWVSSRVTPLRDFRAGNRLIGYMDVTRDITERKRMEAQIQQAQAQLAQSARLATVGELSAAVAHHINNPLTTIIADAQVLLHTIPPGQPARESIEAIEAAGWRIQDAVKLLLNFARPSLDTFCPVVVNDTLQNALALIDDHLQAKGIRVTREYDPRLPPIWGNPQQLCDLWVTLLLLARGQAQDLGPRQIAVRSYLRPDQRVAVAIQDDGDPIPEECLNSVFEPALVNVVGRLGTGIELSICRAIVHQHKGEIAVQSHPETGTIFAIDFPKEDPHEARQLAAHRR